MTAQVIDKVEINTNVRAMRLIQKEMAGEWEKAGIYSEKDLDDLCRETRREFEGV